MELQHYLAILRRWGWILALFAIVATAGSYWAASNQPAVYEAQARYLVGPAMQNPNVDSNALRASSQIGQIYAELATSRPLLQNAIDNLKLDIDAGWATKNVAATWVDSTQILTIIFHAPDSETAVQMANAVGEALIERSPSGPSSFQAQRQREAAAAIERLQAAISSTQTDIEQLSGQIQAATDDLTQRRLIVQLDQRRTQLANAQQALNEQYALVQNGSANQIAVLEPALSAWQIAPLVQQSLVGGLIAGLVLGLAVVLLCEYLYDVIYSSQELRTTTGLAYLGGIARHEKLTGPPEARLVVQAQPETLAAESYRMLRANLQASGPQHTVSSLLITSPARGDGKSEIAANLAVSFARAGQQVILIDANLRRPRLTTLFGLDGQPGLTDLLNEPNHVAQPQPVASVSRLSVLPAGAPSLNSSEILASQRMSELLQTYQSQADIVIVDSPPLLYSDALALAPQASGVLLVVSRGMTGRQNTLDAIESLTLVGANILGVVLNRVKPEPAYEYYPEHALSRPKPLFATPTSAGESVAAPSDRARVTMQLHTTTAMPVAEVRSSETDAKIPDEQDGMLGQVLGEYSELFRRMKTPDNGNHDADADVMA